MIRMHIAGPNAEALADEAEAFLAEAFAVTPAREQAAPDPGGTRGEALAVLTFILAVPPAIAATLDIAERLKVAERLDRFLAHLRARAGGADTIHLQAGDQPPMDLTTADRDRIVDVLTQPNGNHP